jgi:hypothetical protein
MCTYEKIVSPEDDNYKGGHEADDENEEEGEENTVCLGKLEIHRMILWIQS